MNSQSILEYLKKNNHPVQDDTLEFEGLKISLRGDAQEILLVVGQGARASLLLAPESNYTRQADKLGVSGESKIGRSDFDDRYVIRDPDHQAGQILSDPFIAAVVALEPFTELELSKKQYRLLKTYSSAESVERDLQALAEVVRLSS